MTDVVLNKRRVKPGKVDRLREWMAEIQRREDEALATLENEGMYTEATFLEETSAGTFLVYFMEAADMGRVREAYAESPHDIDTEHRAVMEEVLADEPSREHEPLYVLRNPDRP